MSGTKKFDTNAITSEVIKMGKCVVIGLQSTGEARTMEALEREEELTAVKKKLSAMEKLNRALQKERTDLLANKKEE